MKEKYKINIIDNTNTSSAINLHNPDYSLEIKKGVEIPKMVNYSQIINPIEKYFETDTKEEINEHTEKPKEQKIIDIKSDYNKYPSFIKSNINKLSIFSYEY